jgi:hypothetical protein
VIGRLLPLIWRKGAIVLPLVAKPPWSQDPSRPSPFYCNRRRASEIPLRCASADLRILTRLTSKGQSGPQGLSDLYEATFRSGITLQCKNTSPVISHPRAQVLCTSVRNECGADRFKILQVPGRGCLSRGTPDMEVVSTDEKNIRRAIRIGVGEALGSYYGEVLKLKESIPSTRYRGRLIHDST